MKRDIEFVIAGVSLAIPEIQVTQLKKIHEADDDGLWWFRLPGVAEDVQVESSSYDCPFLVEHGYKRLTCATVRETVAAVIGGFRPPGIGAGEP